MMCLYSAVILELPANYQATKTEESKKFLICGNMNCWWNQKMYIVYLITNITYPDYIRWCNCNQLLRTHS